MRVAEVVVRILEDEGVEAAFGIPGAAINPVYEYLGTSTKIKHMIARHEEGALHAADGYSRATGGTKLGLAICTSGPAATNFVTGLYTAQIDSIPLIAITGQNARAQLGKEAFQAVDIVNIVKPVCKAAWCVTEPSQVVSIMRKAFWTAREGRPGPVLIDLPLDVQMAEVDYDPAKDRAIPVVAQPPDPILIERALDMLLAAENPIMIMGGGVLIAHATETCVALAEHLSLPVVTTYMATGGIPAQHPLHVGHIGIQVGSALWQPLFPGFGCRLGHRQPLQRPPHGQACRRT
jgi:tartronate-semialdehyde synthase